LLFRHAQGATEGFRGFADELRAAGHVVHAPDLYEGRTFASLEEGVNHAREVGLGTILDADYDEGAASLLTQRVLAFLEDIE
jgi:dienelactone hydrolase